MITLTQAQKSALQRLWERDQDTVRSNRECELEQNTSLPERYTRASWPSEQVMLANVKEAHDGTGCVMIEWRGMWLGIETDGYTHS